MTTDTNTLAEPQPELLRRAIAAGEARVAVFRRSFDAPIEDVWDACTNPERLARWYTTVTGDLRVGGTFEQTNMGSGRIVRCERPHLLTLSLGENGADEIELRLSAGDGGATTLELQHATTVDQHEIGGQMFDAIYCMGGGYYPRFVALDRLLRGTLPEDYDSPAFRLTPERRPATARASSPMAELLETDRGA